MGAVRELAGYLAEYGGDLHTHDGWIARGADGRMVDGYRYARRVPHVCGADCDAPCPGWHWRYVGRAFADVDAVDVLLEVIGGCAVSPAARAWNAFVCWAWYAFGCPPRFPLRRIR